MHYAAQVWSAGIPTVATAKALGVLAMRELTAPPRAAAHEDPSIRPELRRLLVWIEHNLGRDITAVELAGVAGRGVTTVNRLFRRELQTSPMNWVIERRIDRARQLLSRTHQTVAQVAHAVGCADPYYFSRLFKDRTGMSPSQWRNRHSAP
jgi:transcriptional regulator GlxA family with amidase domain